MDAQENRLLKMLEEKICQKGFQSAPDARTPYLQITDGTHWYCSWCGKYHTRPEDCPALEWDGTVRLVYHKPEQDVPAGAYEERICSLGDLESFENLRLCMLEYDGTKQELSGVLADSSCIDLIFTTTSGQDLNVLFTDHLAEIQTADSDDLDARWPEWMDELDWHGKVSPAGNLIFFSLNQNGMSVSEYRDGIRQETGPGKEELCEAIARSCRLGLSDITWQILEDTGTFENGLFPPDLETAQAVDFTIEGQNKVLAVDTRLPFEENLALMKQWAVVKQPGHEDWLEHFEKIIKLYYMEELPAGYFTEEDWLEELGLPDTLKVVRAGAFDACRNLNRLTICAGCTRVEDGAVKDCPSFDGISILLAVLDQDGQEVVSYL